MPHPVTPPEVCDAVSHLPFLSYSICARSPDPNLQGLLVRHKHDPSKHEPRSSAWHLQRRALSKHHPMFASPPRQSIAIRKAKGPPGPPSLAPTFLALAPDQTPSLPLCPIVERRGRLPHIPPLARSGRLIWVDYLFVSIQSYIRRAVPPYLTLPYTSPDNPTTRRRCIRMDHTAKDV